MNDRISDISQKYSKGFMFSKRVTRSLAPDEPFGRLAIGFGLSLLISYAGWRKASLSTFGAVGAVITGTITTARGGYGRAVLLVGFFAASSGIPRLLDRYIVSLEQYTEKGGRRDVWQVAANGGVSSAIALLGASGNHRLLYLGSLAAVTGDTLATEIGGRAGGQPRHILSWKPVQPGASGGISLAGTLASVAGGGFIGGLALISGLFDPAFSFRKRELLLTGLIAGAVGSIIDSVAGATIQERRWCDRCEALTERRVHSCDQPARIVGGVPGVTNDGVNVICTLCGLLVGMILERYGICR